MSRCNETGGLVRLARRSGGLLAGLLLASVLAGTALAQSGSCPDPDMCFLNQSAMDAWAQAQDCEFDDSDTDGCTESWRLDDEFLEESEGALVLEGYIPRQGGEILGVSGVTISTGIDLGQQSASGTRSILDAYIAESGETHGADVDELMEKLDPYFGLQKEEAASALEETPLSVSNGEAVLLAEAFKHHFLNQIASQFDRDNHLGMEFRRLPEAAQTVIMDFAYQYGLSTTQGSVRQAFWEYVYNGQWNELADWLQSGPDPYDSRRRREGDLLEDAIEEHKIPAFGDPCPGQATGD